MLGKIRVAAVELRVVAQRLLHRGGAVVGHERARCAAKRFQRPYMRREPVRRRLGPGRFHTQLRAVGPYRDEQPRLVLEPGLRIDDDHRIAGVVDEQLIPGRMLEREGHRTAGPPGLELDAKCRVPQSLRVAGQVLAPQLPACDVLALHLALHPLKIWRRLHSVPGVRRGYSSASSAPSSWVGDSGQATPALSARPRQPCTLERAHPTLRAISRSLNPSARSRSTSRIFLMDNLACATLDPPCSMQKGQA